MAEFLNLQSNIETILTKISEAYANMAQDRFVGIEDSARLISGIPPQSIAMRKILNNTAYKVNLEITGCLGKSLSYSMNKFQEKPRINPNNLLNWAIEKLLLIQSY